MGLVKLTTNNVVQAEGILQLTASITTNTLTIDVVYALDMGSNKLAKANIVYTKGASNSFTLTEGEYLEEFADIFGLAMGTILTLGFVPVVYTFFFKIKPVKADKQQTQRELEQA